EGLFLRLALRLDRRLRELVLDDEGSRQGEQLAKALALVHRARFAADLCPGAPEQRVVRVAVDGHQVLGRRGAAALEHAVPPRLIQLARLPRTEPVAQLIGVPGGIARRLVRLRRKASGRLVVLPAPSTG